MHLLEGNARLDCEVEEFVGFHENGFHFV
jgi:hypothetical protein